MNEINAQRRLKDAATAKADGEKILLVKAAEADKEAKYLSGLGVAQQRRWAEGGNRREARGEGDTERGRVRVD